ncbi:hypothetical protein CYMTET_22704, partial [Cymbomonas tetramitiformis]
MNIVDVSTFPVKELAGGKRKQTDVRLTVSLQGVRIIDARTQDIREEIPFVLIPGWSVQGSYFILTVSQANSAASGGSAGASSGSDGGEEVRRQKYFLTEESTAISDAMSRTVRKVQEHILQQRRRTRRSEGHYCNFVDEEEARNLECSICSGVVRDAVMCDNGYVDEFGKHYPPCGCVYCMGCIDVALQWRPECPNDRQPLCSAQLRADAKTRQHVLMLKVHCDNRANGCKECVPLKDMPAHLRGCMFMFEECRLGCEKKVLRKDLAHHISPEGDCPLAEVPCTHCQKQLPRAQLEKHVQDECPEVAVPCIFNCRPAHDPSVITPVIRREMQRHIDTHCPNAPVVCP